MRLTGLQIAAGIALAGMTREGLAKEAKIGRNTLDRIINDTSIYREDTIAKIRGVLELHGIEFTAGSGVRIKDRIIETYEGEGANKRLIEDLYDTLRKTGGEILVAHVDEGESVKNLERSWLAEQIRKRKEAGITHRLLVRADDPNLIPPFDSYRCVPNEFFSPYPLFIYGSKLALLSWDPSPRVVIVDDERFAESARKLFNFIWSHAEPVSPRKATKA
jgi:transcriptional regulator with XRE-family HTH domain